MAMLDFPKSQELRNSQGRLSPHPEQMAIWGLLYCLLLLRTKVRLFHLSSAVASIAVSPCLPFLSSSFLSSFLTLHPFFLSFLFLHVPSVLSPYLPLFTCGFPSWKQDGHSELSRALCHPADSHTWGFIRSWLAADEGRCWLKGSLTSPSPQAGGATDRTGC